MKSWRVSGFDCTVAVGVCVADISVEEVTEILVEVLDKLGIQ
jgi:hypothetical protein